MLGPWLQVWSTSESLLLLSSLSFTLRQFDYGISAVNAGCSDYAEFADDFVCPVSESRSESSHCAFLKDFRIRMDLMSIFLPELCECPNRVLETQRHRGHRALLESNS